MGDETGERYMSVAEHVYAKHGPYLAGRVCIADSVADAHRIRDALNAAGPPGTANASGEADRLANVAAAQVIAWWDEEGETTAFRRIREAVGDPPANAKHAAEYACDIVGSLLREAFAQIQPGPASGVAPQEGTHG